MLPGAVLDGPADPGEEVEITLVLRRRARAGAADLTQTVDRATWRHPRLSREELAMQHGADPADLERVTRLAAQRQMQALDADVLKRHVQLNWRASAVISIPTSQQPQRRCSVC